MMIGDGGKWHTISDGNVLPRLASEKVVVASTSPSAINIEEGRGRTRPVCSRKIKVKLVDLRVVFIFLIEGKH